MSFSKMKIQKMLPPFLKNYQKLRELSDLSFQHLFIYEFNFILNMFWLENSVEFFSFCFWLGIVTPLIDVSRVLLNLWVRMTYLFIFYSFIKKII